MSCAEIISQNKGLIHKICYSFWRAFPTHVKASIDFEDLVSGAQVRILTQAAKYDPERGAVTTWLWTVVTNYCNGERQRYQAQRRLPSDEYQRMAAQGQPGFSTDARDALEEILANCSQELARAFDGFLRNRRFVESQWPQPVVLEMRRLTRWYGVTRDDLHGAMVRV